jgi:hypothetical protein
MISFHHPTAAPMWRRRVLSPVIAVTIGVFTEGTARGSDQFGSVILVSSDMGTMIQANGNQHSLADCPKAPPESALSKASTPHANIRNGSVPTPSPTAVVLFEGQHGIRQCLIAEGDGLHLQFVQNLPFTVGSPLTCERFMAQTSGERRFFVRVQIMRRRTPYGLPQDLICDFSQVAAFVDLSQEGPIGLGTAKPQLVDILIAWSMIDIDAAADAIMVSDPFDPDVDVREVQLAGGGGTVLAWPALQHAAVDPSATPVPAQHVVSGAFAGMPAYGQTVNGDIRQDATVGQIQAAFSNISGLAPTPIPTPSPAPLGQNIQHRIAGFSFAYGNPLSNDLAVQTLTAIIPYSPSKSVTSLTTGYAYSGVWKNLSTSAFYDTVSPGVFTSAISATITASTAPPQPSTYIAYRAKQREALYEQQISPLEVTPTPIAQPTSAAAPISFPVESSLINAPPAELFVMKSASALTDPTTNLPDTDNTFALTGAATVYRVNRHDASSYQSGGLQLFGAFQNDAQWLGGTPSPMNQSAWSAGQTATRTLDVFPPGSVIPRQLHLSETVGVQKADAYYSPSYGVTNALTPLSGPVGNVSGLASCLGAVLCSASFTALRMTNANKDLSAVTDVVGGVAFPGSTSVTVSYDAHVRSESRRIAALESGAVAQYTPALVTNTTPTLLHGVIQSVSVTPSTFDVSKNSKISLTFAYEWGSDFTCTANPVVTTAVACAVTDLKRVGFVGDYSPAPSLHIGFSSVNVNEINRANSIELYSGSYFTAPGSEMAYIIYGDTRGLQVLAAYANANFVTGQPLPEAGKTLTGQVIYDALFDQREMLSYLICAGYYNQRSDVASVRNQGGYLIGIHLLYRPCFDYCLSR